MRSRFCFPSHFYYVCEVIYGDRESFRTEAISAGNVTFALSSTASTRSTFARSSKRASSGGEAFHVVDPELQEEHLKLLAEAGINVHRAIDTGQLEVRRWQDAYLRGDHFDKNAMLALIEEVLQSANTAGYPFTRLLAHMEWALLDKPGVDNLVEYETRLNYLLPKYDDPVVCTHDLSKFDASVTMDILRSHPVVIIGGVLQENPFFVPPDQFLHEIWERQSARNSAGVAS